MILTIQGLISNQQVELDLQTIVDVFDWYVKDAPREKRSLDCFIKVMHMYDALNNLYKLETAKGFKDIEDKLDSLSGLESMALEEDE